MGRRAHRPDPSQRRQVEAMAAYGIPEDNISRVIGVDPKTLRKHYRDELDLGERTLRRRCVPGARRDLLRRFGAERFATARAEERAGASLSPASSAVKRERATAALTEARVFRVLLVAAQAVHVTPIAFAASYAQASQCTALLWPGALSCAPAEKREVHGFLASGCAATLIVWRAARCRSEGNARGLAHDRPHPSRLTVGGARR